VGEVIVKNILLAGIAFVALVAPAAAADMPVKAPPVPIDIWTGGYVGANVGYSWGDDTINSIGNPGNCSSTGAGCAPGAAPVSVAMAQAASFQTSIDRSGVIYGGQAGHNWLVNNCAWTWNCVLGIEVDFQGVSDSHSITVTNGAPIAGFPANSIAQTATFSERIDTLGTVRGRAGVLWGPNTLIYGTGGVAFAHVTASDIYNQNLLGPVGGGTGPYFAAGSASQELFGPTIGGGIEWKWTANLSVKAEYLYADLYSLTVNNNLLFAPQFSSGGAFGTATAQTNTHIHENIARVGVNYRFW
jgi:outer membrane immunogenic protein